MWARKSAFLPTVSPRRIAARTPASRRRSGSRRRRALRASTHELDELKQLANGRPFEQLTATDIRGAVSRAHARGLSARSIGHRLSAWRAFYRWLAGRIDLPVNPVATVRAPKQAKTLPKALSVDDAHTLMEAPAAGTPEGLRDHAMMELFYSSGLRLSELVGLDVTFADADGYR